MSSKQNTVLVTGANGYLASWIVKKLLIEGHTVHATVRDIHNREKINHLLEYEKNLKEILSSSQQIYLKKTLLMKQ